MESSVAHGPAIASATNPKTREFTGGDFGALAHLYRAEVYRSTIWRSRLDNSTNWAVASLGLSVSAVFSSKEASPFPLLIVAFFILAFLVLEARRYRYFNLWRTRARWMEVHFYAPMLRGELIVANGDWARSLAGEYDSPMHRISLTTSLHRRLKRNYLWIFVIQLSAYFGKISLHPAAATSASTLVERAEVGPIPGAAVLGFGMLFYGVLFGFCILWPMLEARQSKDGDALKVLVDRLGPDIA